MNDNNDFDFERFKAEAIKGMYAGRPLNGEKGIFAPLLKHFLESALEGELDAHFQEEKAQDHPTGVTARPLNASKASPGSLIWIVAATAQAALSQ